MKKLLARLLRAVADEIHKEPDPVPEDPKKVGINMTPQKTGDLPAHRDAAGWSPLAVTGGWAYGVKSTTGKSGKGVYL